jgi:hypothetical protein
MAMKITALLLTATIGIAVTGCSSSAGKQYDISPIFPLSSGKCAKYHGDQHGEGFNSTCLVTKSECERAAADWRQAMREGYVNDAIQFSCK